jgi:Fe-S cluster biogenesis protein NfuA
MREPLPTDQPAESTAAGLPAPADATLFRRDVERVLALIRPSVQEDGGDIELVEAVTPDLVRIRFLGACVGCPSSSMTLHHGIERTLRTRLSPAIRVEAVS